MAKSSNKKNKEHVPDALALESILNSTDELLMLLNDKLDIVYYNKQIKSFYEVFFKKTLIAGNNILSYSIPGLEGKSQAVCNHVLAGAIEKDEFTVHHPANDGILYYRARFKPVRDSSHQVVGVLVSFKEKSLSVMINNCFSLQVDLKESLRQLLAAWCRHFELRAAEVWIMNESEMNMKLLAVHAEGNPLEEDEGEILFPQVVGLTEKSWQSGTPVFMNDIHTDALYKRKRFAEVNQLTSATAIPVSHKNKPVAVLLFYNKPGLAARPVVIKERIISRLATEIEGKKSEDNLTLLFKYTPEFLCIAGPDGYLKKVNPAFSKLLGYTEQELISQPFIRFVHPDDVNNTISKTSDMVSGLVIHSFENRYRTKSNEWKWISWSTSEVMNDEVLVFAYGKDITEEKKLRELLYSTSKLAKIGSWEIDLINDKTYWSPSTRLIFEVDDTVMADLDLQLSFFKEGENRETIKRLIQHAIDDAKGWNDELLIVTVRGNERWVRIIGQSEFMDGKCNRLFGSIQDIHEEKTAKLETEKVLQEKKDILESIGAGFFTMDNNWIVTYWNKHAERMTNIPNDQVIGKNFWDVLPERINTPFHTYCIKALTSQEAQYFETYYETEKAGYEMNVYPKQSGLSVYFKDATARIQADEKIRQSNERFELIAKATKDAIWEYDLQTHIFTNIGDGFTRLSGYSQDGQSEDIGFLKSLMHPDDLQWVIDSKATVIEDINQNYWEGEYRIQTKEGRIVHVLECCYIMRDQQGRAIKLMGANKDITYRKENAQSLQKLNEELDKYAHTLAASNAELEQFAYVASHDLQEPLRMVSSFMTMLEKNYHDKLDDRGKQYIHFAVDGATRMKQIIQDLLEYSRVGRFSKSKEEVNLKEIVAEVMVLNGSLISEKQAKVEIGPLPVIRSHRTPLRQVFQNLIGNSLKYTRQNIEPKIKVACLELETEYQFEVSDNGVGIAPEHFQKIFVIFQRLHTRNEYEGTGLGLSVCKRIVVSLGGKIWVEAEEGKGSSFYFTIPKHS